MSDDRAVAPVGPRPGRRSWPRDPSPRGVLVLGMHRSGTSAAAGLVTGLGLATCAPGDMVRGPWNPSGHFESRSLMHLNDALLAQMGLRWWYPPPVGAAYAQVAARITTTPRQARRVFRRVHRTKPWVWKDPRTSVLIPFWRRALGAHVAAVVVFRNPLEVATSLQRRHSLPLPFGVALWERYNRLILAHSARMRVLVTRYTDLVVDPAGWSARTGGFLEDLGMRVALPPDTATQARDFIDPELRHSTHSRTDLIGVGAGALAVYDALEAAVGSSPSFEPPELPTETADVTAALDAVGPRAELAWHPPPWATDGGAPPPADTGERT